MRDSLLRTVFAGCGGEEVRRFAAFPPHPLRTRFSQRMVKRLSASASEPHSVLDCPMMMHHYAKSLARESGSLFDACYSLPRSTR